MPDLLTPADVERIAETRGKSVSEICRLAAIAPSTFSRWKAGKTEPTLTVYRKIVAALETADSSSPDATRNPASPTASGVSP